MINLSDKTCLIKDKGLGMEHAVRLAKDFGKVKYFTPWTADNASFNDYILGEGFEKVENILYFFDHVDKADLIVYTDVDNGDEAAYLRKQGKRVFSSGRGEKLEHDRWNMRQLQGLAGLPKQESKRCMGVEELIKHLKRNDNQYIKHNIFRKEFETSFCPKYEDMAERIEELRVAYGPFANEHEFLCENEIKAVVEIGIDGFFAGTWASPTLYGYESGRAYIGTYTDNPPPFMKKTMDALTPILNKLGYRGAISTEERVVSIDKSFLQDITARFPFSLSLAYTEYIKNYSPLLWSVADGNPIPLEPAGKYVAGVPIAFDEGKESWIKFIFDSKLREQGKLKFRSCAAKDGKFYTVPERNGAAYAVSVGNTIKEVVEDCKNTIKQVKASYEMVKGTEDALDKIIAEIKKGRAIGLDF